MIAAGADLLAVVGDVFGAADPAARARMYRAFPARTSRPTTLRGR